MGGGRSPRASQALTARWSRASFRPFGEKGASREAFRTRMKVYVPKDLHRALKLRAVEEGKEISELVEEAVRRFLL